MCKSWDDANQEYDLYFCLTQNVNAQIHPMVVVILSIVLAIAGLVWIWKVPIKKTVSAMKKNGSSTVEAYSVVVLLLLLMSGTVYMIAQVV